MTDQERQNPEGQEQQTNQTPPPIPQYESQQPEQVVDEQSYYQPQSQYSGEQADGQPQSQASYSSTFAQDSTPPQNYMAMNIVATALGLFCCGTNCCISLILGIIGIVFATQVNSKYMMGDTNGAESSANTAKILGIVSLVLTGISFIGSVIYFFIMLNTLGGWDAYMEMIQEMVEQMQYGR